MSGNRENVYKLIGHFADKILDDVIWYKKNPIPTSIENCVTNSYEHIFILTKDKNLKLKVNKLHNFKNVIELASNSNNQFVDIHHAVMNIELAKIVIQEFTQQGDLVLDPFMGMGTTGVVCKMLDRKYTGFEICEEYYNKSLERIENGFIQEDGNEFETNFGLF